MEKFKETIIFPITTSQNLNKVVCYKLYINVTIFLSFNSLQLGVER